MPDRIQRIKQWRYWGIYFGYPMCCINFLCSKKYNRMLKHHNTERRMNTQKRLKGHLKYIMCDRCLYE